MRYQVSHGNRLAAALVQQPPVERGRKRLMAADHRLSVEGRGENIAKYRLQFAQMCSRRRVDNHRLPPPGAAHLAHSETSPLETPAHLRGAEPNIQSFTLDLLHSETRLVGRGGGKQLQFRRCLNRSPQVLG